MRFYPISDRRTPKIRPRSSGWRRVRARMQANSSWGSKGLGKIVVRAAVQPFHLVGHLGAGGEHQHRRGVSAARIRRRTVKPSSFGSITSSSTTS